MDQCQQELRRAAAQAFIQSLNQLEETLHSESEPPTIKSSAKSPLKPPAAALPSYARSSVPAPASQPASPQPANPQPASPLAEEFFDSSFEAAVADIEQFIQEREQERAQESVQEKSP